MEKKTAEETVEEIAKWVGSMSPPPGAAVTRKTMERKLEDLISTVRQEAAKPAAAEQDCQNEISGLAERLVPLLEHVSDDYLDAHFPVDSTLSDIAEMIVMDTAPPVVKVKLSVSPKASATREVSVEGIPGTLMVLFDGDLDSTIREYMRQHNMPEWEAAYLIYTHELHPYFEQLLKEILEANTEYDNSKLAYKVMALFEMGETRDTLLWHCEDGRFAMSANVSDVFDWGSADAEDITHETLPILADAFRDLKARNGDTEWLAELYAARIRKMRPQNAVLNDMTPEIRALFEACGPEREVDFRNPKPRTPNVRKEEK